MQKTSLRGDVVLQWWLGGGGREGRQLGRGETRLTASSCADPALGRGQLLGVGGHSQGGRERGWQAEAEEEGGGKLSCLVSEDGSVGERSWKCGGGWKLGLAWGAKAFWQQVGPDGLRLPTGDRASVCGGCGLG